MRIKFSKTHIDYIIKTYATGIGITTIAKSIGVSARPVQRVLSENGIHIRNRGEQQQSRMDNTSYEERKRLTSAAHKAVAGRKAPESELIKRAKSREKSTAFISTLELEFSRIFDSKGIIYNTQTAIGKYNCDFTIGRVVVEVWGGQWHFTGRHLARTPDRVKYLANAGYDTIIVPINNTNFLNPALIDDLIESIDRFSRKPTSSGQYRMIWRDGNSITVSASDCNKDSFMSPFRNRRNTKSGRYESIP